MAGKIITWKNKVFKKEETFHPVLWMPQVMDNPSNESLSFTVTNGSILPQDDLENQLDVLRKRLVR